MKIIIDTVQKTLVRECGSSRNEFALFSDEAFEIVSYHWLKVGWNQKYPYTFSWMGRPIIQLPEDLIRIQEAIWSIMPDVILETGIAHGGSLIFYSSLCKAMGHGRVIGIDIEIRPNNRQAIEEHPLFSYITLIEGSSVDPEIVGQAKSLIQPGEKVLVILDSNHTRQHVLDELEAYHDLVSPGSYLVATDGIMKDLTDVPRGSAEWIHDNPTQAALEFSQSHPEFVVETPTRPFDESTLKENLTHWPGAWLRRI